MTKQQQAKAAKLLVLARYFVKKAGFVGTTFYPAGSVVLRVRNGEGREYTVILRRNKIHECNCPHIPSEKCPECYHILETKRIENAKAKAAKQAARVAVAVQEVQDGLLQLPERAESLELARIYRNIDAWLAGWAEEIEREKSARAATQDIENRLARAGLMARR